MRKANINRKSFDALKYLAVLALAMFSNSCVSNNQTNYYITNDEAYEYVRYIETHPSINNSKERLDIDRSLLYWAMNNQYFGIMFSMSIIPTYEYKENELSKELVSLINAGHIKYILKNKNNKKYSYDMIFYINKFILNYYSKLKRIEKDIADENLDKLLTISDDELMTLIKESDYAKKYVK